jgi:hypothetical protein
VACIFRLGALYAAALDDQRNPVLESRGFLESYRAVCPAICRSIGVPPRAGITVGGPGLLTTGSHRQASLSGLARRTTAA